MPFVAHDPDYQRRIRGGEIATQVDTGVGLGAETLCAHSVVSMITLMPAGIA